MSATYSATGDQQAHRILWVFTLAMFTITYELLKNRCGSTQHLQQKIQNIILQTFTVTQYLHYQSANHHTLPCNNMADAEERHFCTKTNWLLNLEEY